MPFDLDQEFAKASGKKKTIPDGDYTVEIKSADLRETKAGEVFSIKLTILDDNSPYHGKELERAIFLAPHGNTEQEKQESFDAKVNDLKKDLRLLGFDVDDWKPPARPFRKQCVVACRLMKDCKLKVRVKTSTSGFQNVYINERLKDDGKPEKFGAAEMAVAPEAEPFTTDPDPKNEDPIPF